MRRVRSGLRGRSGYVLIFRFTPRGLRRLRLELTRSCRILKDGFMRSRTSPLTPLHLCAKQHATARLPGALPAAGVHCTPRSPGRPCIESPEQAPYSLARPLVCD